MKKIITLALVAIATATSAFAAPKTTKVTDQLSARFKNAKSITWTSFNNFERATFGEGAATINAYYTVEGDLIGTSKTMDFDKLPQAAIETITTKYTFPEYRLNGCIEWTDAANYTSYYVSFENNNETVAYEVTKSGKVRYLGTNQL